MIRAQRRYMPSHAVTCRYMPLQGRHHLPGANDTSAVARAVTSFRGLRSGATPPIARLLHGRDMAVTIARRHSLSNRRRAARRATHSRRLHAGHYEKCGPSFICRGRPAGVQMRARRRLRWRGLRQRQGRLIWRRSRGGRASCCDAARRHSCAGATRRRRTQ